MNDDFLHRIRVEPPAAFMASLKGSLDRQLPPPAVAPKRTLFRVLAFALLFGGSVFAISLLTVNGLPDFARNFVQMPHQDSKAKTDATGHPDAPTRSPGDNRLTPFSTRQRPTDGSEPAGTAVNSPRSTGAPAPANNTAATVQSIAGSTSGGPRKVINLLTPKALQEYMQTLADNFGRSGSNGTLSITATDSSSDTLTRLCAAGRPAGNGSVQEVASVPRRITRAEFEVCTRNIGNIAEVPMGYQAIVLARARLYGTLAVSASDIFLALAAEIPDPAHPQTLISNPNTTWDRVNGAFNSEPIEVFGPPAQSMTGIAFRELLFEVGCNSFPTIAALKQTDGARYERVCRTFRKDGAYVEMPEVPFDAFQTLQTHPNAIGVLAYGLFQSFGIYPQNSETLTTIPIGGVIPTREMIVGGTYPGSRTLYLYIDQRHATGYGSVPFWITPLVETSRVFGSYSVLPLDAEQVQAIRKNPAKLPDLKL